MPNPKLKPSNTTEIGATGLPGSRPRDGYLTYEMIPKLRGQKGQKIFRQMAENDPVLGAILFAIEYPVRALSWTIEPVDDSDAGQEAKDFVEEVLFRDMTTPFGDVIAEALSFIAQGYALSEIVWSRRKDGRIGLAKLSPRSQESIERWEFNDEGDLLGAWQQPEDGGHFFLPVDRLLHFRTTSRLNNPEGRSLQRNAYISWIRKNTIEEAEGRGAVRASGIVVTRIPGKYLAADADASQKGIAMGYQRLGEALAKDAHGSVVIPSDRDANGNFYTEIDYLIADGRRSVDQSPIIDRYNRLMATTVLADFVLLGQQGVGSYALAMSKTSFFGRAIGAVVDTLLTEFNTNLLPKLWKLNGLDPAMMPSLEASRIEPRDLTSLAQFIKTLTEAGMPFFPDEKLAGMLRAEADLPLEDDALMG